MDETILQRIGEMTAHLQFRLGGPTTSDARAFADLFNATYARRVAPAYYHWQFFEAPNPGACLFVEDQDKLVGVYGIRVLDFALSQPVRLGLLVDLIVAPELRRLGLVALMEYRMETIARDLRCAAIYASPNAAAASVKVGHMDWTALPPRIFATVSQPTFTPPQSTLNLRMHELKTFPAEVDPLLQAFHAHYCGSILLRRSRPYLNWRYAINPWHRYSIQWFQSDLNIQGFTVCKEFISPDGGEKSGDIVDLVAQSQDPDLIKAMLAATARKLFSQGCQSVDLWLTGAPSLDDPATALGFRPATRQRHLCFKLLDPALLKDFADTSRWMLLMGDVEIF